MDEVWVRLGLIGGALIVAVAMAAILRSRSKGPARDLASTGLAQGVYLFSSSTCRECRPARKKLTEALGEDGFHELNWEREPGLFYELEIDAVPVTLIVDHDGNARAFPGQPEEALAFVGP